MFVLRDGKLATIIKSIEHNQEEKLFNLKSMRLTKNNEFDLTLLESDEFLEPIQIDFNGLESAIDYLIHEICDKIKKHHADKTLIKLNEYSLKGCKHLTIWSFHYLENVFELQADVCIIYFFLFKFSS